MSSSTIWGGAYNSSPSDVMSEINPSIDFDKILYKQDISGSRAHAQMLVANNVITKIDCDSILFGLEKIEQEIESGTFTIGESVAKSGLDTSNFSRDLEDIHMNIESRLTEIVGEAGKRLHTARSRNDQVATDLKLYTIDAIADIESCLKQLLHAICARAEENIHKIAPSFTHLQIAQPVSLGHYLMAYFEMFLRDLQRIQTFSASIKMYCPLGSCAIAGTSHTIDRHMTAQSLGFNSPSRNSIDSVSDRDFVLEFLSISSIIAVHLSRLAEEMVIWSSANFGFIKFSDAFSTGSSIMPQKKNPDAAELVRGKSGRIFGNLMSMLSTMKALPLAYSKDMQEDKEPLFDSHKTISTCLRAMSGMILDVSFNYENLENSAALGYANATDLADYFVQDLKIPFRDAHHITGKIVKFASEKSLRIEQISIEDLQKFEPQITNNIYQKVDIRSTISNKKSYGGTAFDNVEKMIHECKNILKNI